MILNGCTFKSSRTTHENGSDYPRTTADKKWPNSSLGFNLGRRMWIRGGKQRVKWGFFRKLLAKNCVRFKRRQQLFRWSSFRSKNTIPPLVATSSRLLDLSASKQTWPPYSPLRAKRAHRLPCDVLLVNDCATAYDVSKAGWSTWPLIDLFSLFFFDLPVPITSS